MATWIVLGVMIFIIGGFLLFTSIMDRKTAKKQKEKKEKLENDSSNARGNVAIWVMEVLAENKKMLDGFVPSIGKYKMSDIKKNAKDSIEALAKTKVFKLALLREKNQDILDGLKKLVKTPSNTWEKNAKEELELFTEESKVSGGEYEEFRKEAQKIIGGIYGN